MVKKVTTVIQRVMREAGILLGRNKILLCYPNLRAKKHQVNLNYYRTGYQEGCRRARDTGLRNLGDDLAPCILEHMLLEKGLTPGSPAKKGAHLYTVGSILLMGYQDAVVWGSGILTAPGVLRNIFHAAFFRKLDIRCVRGPLTRSFLLRLGHTCPEIYGDPGCLMPLIYMPKVEKTLEYLVIPHLFVEKSLSGSVPEENMVSMNTDDYKAVIDKICSAKKVISSSLHGIILAEAYGVPAIFFQNRPSLFDFKYTDWYLSTGREFGPKTADLAEAIAMDPGPAPDLTDMQQRLLRAFPYDLWTAP